MATPAERAERFRALHRQEHPLVMPNPWDIGSAKVLASFGFEALATTSSGFAATLGRFDGHVSRDEALAHAAAVAEAVEVPVSADLENCFADDPEGVAGTVRRAATTGLAGCSVEDSPGTGVYPPGLAVERVAAAVEAQGHLVLTARAENYLRGHPDIDDTIARLTSFQEAGADVLFAPGLPDAETIRLVVEAVDRPLNVLCFPGGPTIRDLAELGVARVSVGGALARLTFAVLADAAGELREGGALSYGPSVAAGRQVMDRAFR